MFRLSGHRPLLARLLPLGAAVGTRSRCSRLTFILAFSSLFASREPMFAFVFDESLFVFAYDTPPFAFALLFDR